MRVEKFLKNSAVSVLVQFMTMALSFVSRRVFVEYLPIDLLGYQSLFSNVLSLLSVADIGVQNIIVYHLYREIAAHNEANIRKFIEISKVYYRIIAAVVMLIGLVIIPLLPYVIKGEVTEGWGFLLEIYILQLISVVSGYLLSYRSTMYAVDQKAYKCAVVGLGGQFAQQCAQISILVLTHNYILFLYVRIGIQILQNLVIHWMAGREYTYLAKPCKLTREDIRQANLLQDAKNFFIHKLSFFVYDSTDSFLISGMIGIRMTALYTNYYTVEQTVITLFLGKVLKPMQTAVGNYIYSSQSPQRQKEIFEMLNFFSFLLAAFVATCFWTLYQPFITIWLGQQYLLPFSFVVAVSAKLYLQLGHEVIYMYRSAYGNFQYDRSYMIWAAVVNLASSILLLRFWGITGVKVGTILGLIVILMGRIRFVFHRHKEFSMTAFFKTQMIFHAVFLLDVIVTSWLVDFMPDSLYGFLGKLAISVLTPNAIHLVLFFRTRAFQNLLGYALGFLRKKR